MIDITLSKFEVYNVLTCYIDIPQYDYHHSVREHLHHITKTTSIKVDGLKRVWPEE